MRFFAWRCEFVALLDSLPGTFSERCVVEGNMLSNLPEAILSARMFSGQGAPASERGDVLARFGEPREVVRALEAAADAGCGGVLTLGDETIVAALKRVRESRPDFQVLPIIPNVLGYVREATEHGLAGAGIRRLLRVGPVGFFRAGMRGALHAPQVLRQAFPDAADDSLRTRDGRDAAVRSAGGLPASPDDRSGAGIWQPRRVRHVCGAHAQAVLARSRGWRRRTSRRWRAACASGVCRSR